MPARVRGTEAQMDVYGAALCREVLWHGEDVTGTVAQVRATPDHFPPELAAKANSPEGLARPDHGPPLAWLYDTGPTFLMGFQQSSADQLAFIARTNATTLFTFPSNLRLLLTHMQAHGITLRTLRTVRTCSEVVDPPLRALCHQVLGLKIIDTYAAHETGLLATQCPDHEHYHIAAESCLLEVLDDDNLPCQPGQIGRVVVTPLHNFAMPLIRYEIGDLAELGAPCPCGRGLPVLAHIVGRTHETILRSDGTRRSLIVGYGLARIPAIREFQLAQTEPDAIQIRIVATRPLTAAETTLVYEVIQLRTGPGIALTIVCVDHLPRTRAGKLRLFVSEMPA